MKKQWEQSTATAPAGFVKVGVALACALFVVACAAKSTTEEAHHATHPMRAENLRNVMRGFDEAVRQDVPAETDQYDRWDGVFPSIADAAASLRKSAIQLSGHPPDGLELPARGRFQVLARSLESAAQQLEDAAARSDADAVALARADVGSACRECHKHFRPDSPGVPDAFR
ncbi:MAG: cytochrome c [Candidatus Binatia bacterium]